MSLITHNRQGSFLLKVLLLVFALHTSIGYAACCIALEPADAETSMPCHDKKHDKNMTINMIISKTIIKTAIKTPILITMNVALAALL